MKKRFLGSIIAAGLAVTACSSGEASSQSGSSTSAAASGTTAAAASPAASGSADSGVEPFGAGGSLTTPISPTDHDRYISVVEGADGLVYASGFTSIGEDHAFAVTRFADGAIDPTFGTGGTAVVNVAEGGGGAEVARGLVVQSDGKVLVAGPVEKDPAAEGDAAKEFDVAVIRLDTTGAPDATFGEGGITRIDLGPGRAVNAETYLTDNAWGLTARDGGYAVFATTPNQGADRTDADYAVVGLTDAGAVDTAFGTEGKVVVDLDASGDSARNIGTQSDGKILATGYSRDGDGVVSPVLIRMSPAGVLDETFGTGGVANHIVLPGVTESYQWVSQGENYVLAGYGRGASSDEKVDLVAYRFLADGSWDQTFGTAGVTRIDLAGQDDRGRNLTVLPNGNILAVGSGKLDAENLDAMVVQLDADGAPVETFGDGGHLLVDLGGPGDAFFGVTLTADESAAILAGFRGADPDGAENDDAVLALLPL
ncbi:MAG TPA: hypothetical protein VIU11_06805 [Nakamurella sp.]